MERTQIYFDKLEKEKLLKAAHKRGISMAELIREAVSDYLVKEEAHIRTEDDPIAELRGFIKNSNFTTADYIKQKTQDKELENEK